MFCFTLIGFKRGDLQLPPGYTATIEVTACKLIKSKEFACICI